MSLLQNQWVILFLTLLPLGLGLAWFLRLYKNPTQ